ncbi:MAG TPA: extracellular solute-binding protein [Symbiobacteriaceae bacterium]|nr:extracellular solute-binding protein [Symbiobacteriaceae bacterium]
MGDGFKLTRRQVLQAGAFAGMGALLWGAAGCSRPASKPEQSATLGSAEAYKGTLNLYGWSAVVETIQKRVDAFTAAKKLPVSYTNTAWAQYHDAAVTKFTGNAPMDVVYCSDAWVSEWAEAGWIVPIDGFPGVDDLKKDLVESAVSGATYKGKYYGLPYYADYMAFLYNAEHLEKAGIKAPPATWDEVVQQAKQIKAAGVAEYPMLLALAQETWLTEYICAMTYSRGGSLFSQENDALFDQAGGPAEAALQWMVDAVHTHKVTNPAAVETGELAALKAMQAGQASFILLGRYRLSSLNDPKQSQIAGKARQAMMPSGMSGKGETVLWSRPYVISAQAAKDKDRLAAAWELMKWLGGKDDQGRFETQKQVLLASGSSFATKPLFADPDVQAYYKSWGDPDLMQRQMDLARTKEGMLPFFPEWDTFNKTAWSNAVLKRSTPAEALAASAAKWRDLKKSWK